LNIEKRVVVGPRARKKSALITEAIADSVVDSVVDRAWINREAEPTSERPLQFFGHDRVVASSGRRRDIEPRWLQDGVKIFVLRQISSESGGPRDVSRLSRFPPQTIQSRC
jgi:hypothetical protein